jgi:hypothetical protein
MLILELVKIPAKLARAANAGDMDLLREVCINMYIYV